MFYETLWHISRKATQKANVTSIYIYIWILSENGNMYKYNVYIAIFLQCTALKNDIRDELLRKI